MKQVNRKAVPRRRRRGRRSTPTALFTAELSGGGSRGVVARNLRALVAEVGAGASSYEVAQSLGMPQRTAYNLLTGRTDPLRTLDQAAGALGVAPWELLVDPSDGRLREVLRAYRGATPEGRRLIEEAAATAAGLARTGQLELWAGDPASEA